MRSIKGALSIVLCLIAVPFIDKNSHSFGDDLLQWMGISAWSGPDRTGFHITLIVALVFLLIGFLLAERHWQKRIPRFGRWFVLFLVVAVSASINLYEIVHPTM